MSSEHPCRRTARATALVGIVWLSACAPLPALRQRDGQPVVTDDAVARAEATIARARLDSALRDGDVPRLLALLDSQIVIVLREGDSVVGRAAVARRLSERYDDVRAAAMHMFPGPIVLCTDGLVETSTDVTLFVGHAQRADTIADKVRVTWRNGGPGAWRLARLEFGREFAGSGPDRRRCPRVEDSLFVRRRFRLAASLPFGLQSLPTKASAENRLREQGYRIGKIPPRGFEIFKTNFGDPDGTIELSQGYVSGRVHLRNDWWGDLLVGYGGASFTSYGYNAVAGSRVRLDVTTRLTAAALLQREWRGLRLGVGPAVHSTTWRQVEDRRDLAPASVVLELRSSASSVGGLAEVAWLRNASSSAFIEVRLWQRFATQTPLPSFGSVAGGGTVRLDATTLWVGFGLAR